MPGRLSRKRFVGVTPWPVGREVFPLPQWHRPGAGGAGQRGSACTSRCAHWKRCHVAIRARSRFRSAGHPIPPGMGMRSRSTAPMERSLDGDPCWRRQSVAHTDRAVRSVVASLRNAVGRRSLALALVLRRALSAAAVPHRVTREPSGLALVWLGGPRGSPSPSASPPMPTCERCHPLIGRRRRHSQPVKEVKSSLEFINVVHKLTEPL